MEDLKKILDERKKKIDTEMYWWLNSKRPFHIGDEYVIFLEKIDVSNKSVKIRIVNTKNQPQDQDTETLLEVLLSSGIIRGQDGF
jgi:hypothetical protein